MWLQVLSICWRECIRAADVPAQAQRFPQRSDDQRAEQPRPSSSTTISEVTLLLMSPEQLVCGGSGWVMKPPRSFVSRFRSVDRGAAKFAQEYTSMPCLSHSKYPDNERRSWLSLTRLDVKL